MRWTVGIDGSEVTWAASQLDGAPWLIGDVEDYARAHAGEHVTPIPGTLIPVGLADPLEAWATITVALSEHRDQGAVRTPPAPEQLGPADRDLVF